MSTLVRPKSQGEMRAYERNGVTLDQCEECHGIFLDRGELEHLVEADRRFNQPPPPQQGAHPPQQPYPPQRLLGRPLRRRPPRPPSTPLTGPLRRVFRRRRVVAERVSGVRWLVRRPAVRLEAACTATLGGSRLRPGHESRADAPV